MEEFFEYDFHVEENMPWLEDTNQSAFVNYEYTPVINGKGPNIHKRMMAMLTGKRQNPVTGADLRSRRHMISERIRRERQKQCYLNLHSLLPPGTKSDKNTVVQTAVQKIEELERVKMDLERKNREIENELIIEEETAKIKLKVTCPSSGIDSVLEVLKCLKESRSKLKAIKSTISPHELSAVLEVQNKIEEAAQIEMDVQRSLFEVERKFRSPVEEKLNQAV